MRSWRHRSALSVALAIALGGAAAAQPAARVAVLARAGTDPPVSAAQTAAALRRAAGAGVQVLLEPRFRAEAVRRERLAAFTRAWQLAEEGWRAYHEVEPSFAETRLVQARRRAIEVADLPGGAELLAEISLRLGAVRLYRGRRDEALHDMRLAATLDPDRPVTRAEFRPSVVELYTRAIAAEPRRAPLALEAPAGAEIELDGERAGHGRARVQVTLGHHLVVARARGYRPAARIVEVGAGGERVAVELERDELAAALDGPLEVGTGEQQAALRIEAATIYGELDGFVLAAPVWRRGAPALLGQRCHGVPARCTAVVEIGFAGARGLPAAAARLWGALAAPGADARLPPTLLVDARLTRGEPRPGRRRHSTPTPWWRRGWLWAGVGTAAVAASAWLLLSRDDSTRSVLVVRPCDFGGACD